MGSRHSLQREGCNWLVARGRRGDSGRGRIGALGVWGLLLLLHRLLRLLLLHLLQHLRPQSLHEVRLARSHAEDLLRRGGSKCGGEEVRGEEVRNGGGMEKSTK